MGLRALVGRFEYMKFIGPKLKDWMKKTWEPLLEYTPCFSMLMKGWICFNFIKAEDATKILEKFWTIGRGSLVLERWQVSFDPKSAPIRKRHLWALLPGLPLA